MRIMPRSIFALALLLAVSVPAISAYSQAAASTTPTGLGFGVNAGLGLNPDEFVAGVQYGLGKPVGIFRMTPNAHVGFGSGTIVDVNWDFLARFQATDGKFSFYAGASPTVTFGSDTELGGTIVAGMQFPMIAKRATELEARFGFAGAPNFRLLLTVVL
jgi:hypothetical protein